MAMRINAIAHEQTAVALQNAQAVIQIAQKEANSVTPAAKMNIEDRRSIVDSNLAQMLLLKPKLPDRELETYARLKRERAQVFKESMEGHKEEGP
jgi:hypothetical protein